MFCDIMYVSPFKLLIALISDGSTFISESTLVLFFSLSYNTFKIDKWKLHSKPILGWQFSKCAVFFKLVECQLLEFGFGLSVLIKSLWLWYIFYRLKLRMSYITQFCDVEDNIRMISCYKETLKTKATNYSVVFINY